MMSEELELYSEGAIRVTQPQPGRAVPGAGECHTSLQLLVQAVWQVLCHGFQPCTDLLHTYNSMSSLCLGTPLFLIVQKHQWQLYKIVHTKGFLETKKLPSLTFFSMSANYSNSAMKCKRRWMCYHTDKCSERQPQILHTAKSTSAPAQCFSEEEEGHTVLL